MERNFCKPATNCICNGLLFILVYSGLKGTYVSIAAVLRETFVPSPDLCENSANLAACFWVST
jgi:hypothetical protein